MSSHNIGFYEAKLSLNYHQISSNTHLISSADNTFSLVIKVCSWFRAEQASLSHTLSHDQFCLHYWLIKAMINSVQAIILKDWTEKCAARKDYWPTYQQKLNRMHLSIFAPRWREWGRYTQRIRRLRHTKPWE